MADMADMVGTVDTVDMADMADTAEVKIFLEFSQFEPENLNAIFGNHFIRLWISVWRLWRLWRLPPSLWRIWKKVIFLIRHKQKASRHLNFKIFQIH